MTHMYFHQGIEVRSGTAFEDDKLATLCMLETAIMFASANGVAIDYIALTDEKMVVSLKNGELPMLVPYSEDFLFERELYSAPPERECRP